MDEITAAKIEGMLEGARIYLENIAKPLRQATPVERQFDRMHKLGIALTALTSLSHEIYQEHPELKPYLKEEIETAEKRRKNRALFGDDVDQ
jgi:hypothetical protein